MRDVTKTTYTAWAILLLVVMLVGSPLAGFGCQTIVPDQFQLSCESSVGQTAVQTNFIQSLTIVLAFLVKRTPFCQYKPQQQSPQQPFLRPPLPPPRSFVLPTK